MTIRFFIHSRSKRAESIALVDSGATENFMSLEYAKYLHLPIRHLPTTHKLFNVDGTPNKSGELQYFTDLQVHTRLQHTCLRFFLTNLGENKAILRYPWFAAVQPHIDWKRGSIDHSQLPIILRSDDTAKAQFLPRTINRLRSLPMDTLFIGQIIFNEPKEDTSNIPDPYQKYTRVFSETASHEFPPARLWDHAIELKPGAPSALPTKLI